MIDVVREAAYVASVSESRVLREADLILDKHWAYTGLRAGLSRCLGGDNPGDHTLADVLMAVLDWIDYLDAEAMRVLGAT